MCVSEAYKHLLVKKILGGRFDGSPHCLVNKLGVIFLQRIMTPLFVSLDMF